MWYMTLPSIIIIAVCSTIPAYVAPHITKFFQGNKQTRIYTTHLERIGYTRDYELGDNKFWNFKINKSILAYAILNNIHYFSDVIM
ncbi:NADH dehydrogenase [ubiquinone] 1 alpha subcomplex subunit [Apis cerana cerana]|uniref:NADH dehydrogenase [ubiquinone] 1 alpha subcomplex subunit n=1 Tax=Apis cerana cerana TaxID=94128 RepID=A0A2A3ELB9_APICC|nr:NADH dehydrogenase [ubiquinone] 1 alpha subcomplex subunit [Apis cerana cerana]